MPQAALDPGLRQVPKARWVNAEAQGPTVSPASLQAACYLGQGAEVLDDRDHGGIEVALHRSQDPFSLQDSIAAGGNQVQAQLIFLQREALERGKETG